MKKILNPILLLINVIGIFVYLKNASLSWVIPEEADLKPGIAGVAMVWGLGALPMLLLFLIVDGIWWSIVFSGHLRKWPALAASFLWVSAVIIDFWHH